MRITPSAKVTVTQIGKPSGMAATAKLTPMVNMSRSLEPCQRPVWLMVLYEGGNDETSIRSTTSYDQTLNGIPEMVLP